MSYTKEMSVDTIDAFVAGNTVEQIAAMSGKSVRSVIAKLSAEKVYTSKDVIKASKEAKVTKADLVAKIAAKSHVDPKSLASLEKATKEVLEILAA